MSVTSGSKNNYNLSVNIKVFDRTGTNVLKTINPEDGSETTTGITKNFNNKNSNLKS